MNNIKKILFTFLLVQFSFSQGKANITWWNPESNEFPTIDGQGWTNEVETIFDRLPARAEKKVGKEVWDLSKQSAGLSIRFWTNADSILVSYKVKRELYYKLISSMGVSGLDLYSKSLDGEWLRCWGESEFDSITNCRFIIDDSTKMYNQYGREYQLFLPLFNEVESLQIGIDEKYFLNPLKVRNEKPIVVYGTSICQGANASRPGMAWSNLLQRKLERPIINLGFSGNGKLEPELINLMAEIDAEMYILDCMPNLSPNKDNVYQLVVNAVKMLKEKRPTIPIILTGHQGFVDEETNQKNKNHSDLLDIELNRAFKSLKLEGFDNLYRLENKDLKFTIDSYSDYGHPNDFGMIQYANAYEKLISRILVVPRGDISTTIPATQSRDIPTYKWEERHQEILKLNKVFPPKICLFGDSIINFWGGEPEISICNGRESWENIMKPLGIRNFGFGYDMIENVLWRIYHDELDGFQADKIMLMIGVNNLSVNDDQEIIQGLELLFNAVKQRQPKSEIILMGLLPAVGKEKRIKSLNKEINQLADKVGTAYYNIGVPLLSQYGQANKSFFMADGLHPNDKGYRLLAKEFKKALTAN